MSMKYTPLNVAKDEIRLLSFLPTEDNVLHLSLEHFPLSSAPPFWAFSYTWGDLTRTRRIVINGHDFESTEDLAFALRKHQEILLLHSKIKHHFQAQHIWADAICINQNDYEERAQQVLRMRQIYQIGIVAIYLNSEDSDAHNTEYTVLYRLGEKGSESGTSKFLQVIQEFVLSKLEPLLFYVGGHKALKHATLRNAAWEILQMDSIPITPRGKAALFHGIKQYLSLVEVKGLVEDNPPCSLLALLWMFRDRTASDPRDKIYSLLGVYDQFKSEGNAGTMAEATGELDIEELILDYEAEVEVVYASFVKAVVARMHSLNILCACQAPANFERSWVLDWSEPWSRISLLTKSMGLVPDESEVRKRRASGTKRATARFSEDVSHLTVNRICWSRVLVLPSREVEKKSWPIEWVFSLDDTTRQLLGNVYGDDTIAQCILAICGGEFRAFKAQARDYHQFSPGASEEWHEMAHNYKEGTVDKNGQGYRYVKTRITQMIGRRKIFVGENGHYGLVPDHAEIGDFICVLLGCDIPVILRQVEDHYTFIGESYVRGLMEGQAIEALERGEVHLQDFEIW